MTIWRLSWQSQRCVDQSIRSASAASASTAARIASHLTTPRPSRTGRARSVRSILRDLKPGQASRIYFAVQRSRPSDPAVQVRVLPSLALPVLPSRSLLQNVPAAAVALGAPVDAVQRSRPSDPAVQVRVLPSLALPVLPSKSLLQNVPAAAVGALGAFVAVGAGDGVVVSAIALGA
jgi:hypothetical protein